MNLDPTLTRAHVMLQLERLLRVYKRPEQASADAAAFASDYVEICGTLTNDQFTGAVDGYLRGTARWFPRPGEMLALGRSLARAPGVDVGSFEAWMQRAFRDAEGRLEPCPACGRAWQSHPRLTIVHNHARHRQARLPCIGTCDEPSCLGTYGVAPRTDPVAVSAGELWMPPAGWTSDLRRDPRSAGQP